MQISAPQPWPQFTAPNPTAGDLRSPHARRLLAHPNSPPLSQLTLRPRLPTTIAIGPEGGFTDAEVATALAVGWQSISLGKSILRIETAAIALAAAIALHIAPTT
jgi:16S rRNA (uracil1498-N3)-methyltransferase